MGPGEHRVPGLVMLSTKGLTRASQHVLPKAWAASSSGRKRSAKPCSCRRAWFSLQQQLGSTQWGTARWPRPSGTAGGQEKPESLPVQLGHPAAPLPALRSPCGLPPPSPQALGRWGHDDTVGRQLTGQRAAVVVPGPGRSPGTKHEPEQCRRGTFASTAAP